MTIFARATPEQLADALNVWHAARTATGTPPSPARIDRVQEKLSDDAACLLVGRDGPVIAMALAEPYREQQGTGAIRPRAGHVSMVFVDPEHRIEASRLETGRVQVQAPHRRRQCMT